ncbi:hypothetical protein JCM10207_006375 [Rhodosporidiobolus poonsookiae]
MASGHSHRAPSVDPHLARTGEWDTPLRHPSSSSNPHLTSTTSTRSRRTPRHSTSTALTRASDNPPVYTQINQQVLSEDDYLAALSAIIKRDFFPHLDSLESRNHVLDAIDSRDQGRILESVKRMRETGATPRVARSRRGDATPLSTYGASHPDATPTHFDRTPMTASSFASTSSTRAPPPDPTHGLSLDAFQSRYTSEDNASFADLVEADNAARRDKHAWAFAAEKRANVRALEGRRAREKLVEVTRRMVEASKDGTVLMLDGEAGRPGERRLLVDEGVSVGKGDRLLTAGRDRKERLLLTVGGEAAAEEGEGKKDAKGKGKAVERVDERAEQYVDWDRPTAEEWHGEEAEVDKLKKLGGEGTQVGVQAWPFTTRNSLMFPPDADRSHPSSLMPPPSSSYSASKRSSSGGVLGDPKGIRHAATRMQELERPVRLQGSGASDAGSEQSGSESATTGGPSRSAIGRAVAGFTYSGNAPSISGTSSTPRVSGFSFVDALPSPSASSLPAQALQELMTWGTIEATPVTLRSSSSFPDGDGSVGPFRIREGDRREELAHQMARRAKRSLAEGASRGKGLAVDARAGSASSTLRRSLLDASTRSSSRTPSLTPSHSGSTPRASAAAGLSPAARTLLGRTKPGRALEAGLGRSKAWGEDEERRRRRRAEERAREVESLERIRRERWTPSPAPSMGFDPDLDELPKHGRH